MPSSAQTGDVPALSVNDVGVSFAGLRALEGVSFQVGERELLGLIGPNGAGKTTLVNVVSGFQRPDRGEVLLHGEPITGLDATERSRRGLARTFQGVRLFERLSVQENIEVSSLNHGGGRKAARRLAREAITVLGLQGSADKLAGSLPYGDQRRLALARCLAMNPTVILMDEPAAGLNEQETVELGDAIQRIREDHGVAIVLVEHDVALVMRLSDRVFVLAEGRPLATGTPEQIVRDPAVAAAYLGVEDAGG
jgi:branched-chain amino acid transport system ATP-binding protein